MYPDPPNPTNVGPWIEGKEIPCPECGRPMRYRRWGWHFDGTPAFSWQCSGAWTGGSLPGSDNPPCWHKVFDGEAPWTVEIHKVKGAWLAYLEKYGMAPIDTQRPPSDMHLQPRLF